MSNLTNLIKFKQDLLDLSRSIAIDTNIKIQINNIVDLQNRYPNINNDVYVVIDKLTVTAQQLAVENTAIINSLLQTINQLDLQLLEIYDSEIHQKNFIAKSITSNSIPKRREIPNQIKKDVIASIRQYSQWKYPTLIIDPIEKGLIDCAIASDPLYLTYPISSNTINKLISKFSETYQKRLRIYKVIDYDFSLLPQGQFSTIVNWNIINVFDVDSLKIYLSKMFNLLRPGGVILTNLYLTIAGDADEWKFFDQIATSTIISICKQTGFTVSVSDIKMNKFEPGKSVPFNYICWLTIRKPGELKTVKAHQALAEIKRK
jgi:hypothetical protein